MAIHRNTNDLKRVKNKASFIKFSESSGQIAMSDLPAGVPVLTDTIPFSNLQSSGPVSQDSTVQNMIALTAPFINAKADAIAPQNSDKFPILRSGLWLTSTWSELLANLPATGALNPFDAKVDGVGKNPGCYASITAAIADGKSYIYVVSGSVDPSVINVTRNIFIYVSSVAHHILTQVGYLLSNNSTLQIITNSSSDQSVYITIFAVNSSGSFFSGTGTVRVNGFQIMPGNNNITLLASGITPQFDNCQFELQLSNLDGYVTLVNFGSYIKNSLFNTYAIGSAAANVFVVGSGCKGIGISFYNATNSTGNMMTIQKGGEVHGLYVSSEMGGGGAPFKMINRGYLQGLVTDGTVTSAQITNDGGTLQDLRIAKATGFAPVAATVTHINTGCTTIDVEYVNVDISVDATAVNATFLSSSLTGGSYVNNGTNTQGFANSGGLPNTIPFYAVTDASARTSLTNKQVGNGQIVVQRSDDTAWIASISGSSVSWIPIGSASGISISPYEATLDNIGTLANHYVNDGLAYTAGKTYVYDMADITETADIQLVSTGQNYIQVGQNFTHDLSTFSIIGSYQASPPIAGGNSMSIELEDSSSVFTYSPSGNLPIANFDQASTVLINGNGGIFINNSTTDNSYIYCAGTLIALNLQFRLPNKAAGGFKTDLYTKLDGIEFSGTGVLSDTPVICNGGAVSDLIFDGTFANNATLLDVVPAEENVLAPGTLYDGILVNVDAPTRIILRGEAMRINTNLNNIDSFLTVLPLSNSTLISSYCDALSLASNVTDTVFGLGRAGLASFPSDNTSQATFVGYTFYNAVVSYGDTSFTACRFLGGITVAGGVASFSNSISVTPLVVTGGSVRRSGNDSNIGNDGSPTIVVSATSRQLVSNTKYICTNAALTTLQLPADVDSVVGDIIKIIGTQAGGWAIAQAALQQIFFESLQTTVGVSGAMSSTAARDCVEIIKIGTSLWQAVSAAGNFDLT
jgi:hypothetical protein